MKTKVVLSVDVGLTGAIAVRGKFKIIEIVDIPSLRLKVRNGTRGEYDHSSLWKVGLELAQRYEVTGVCLEFLAPRGQGTLAAFSLGGGYNLILMWASALGFRIFRYSPATWKKAIFAGYDKPNKETSRVLAKQFFPEVSELFERAKDHDRAEACLLSEYHVRMVGL